MTLRPSVRGSSASSASTASSASFNAASSRLAWVLSLVAAASAAALVGCGGRTSQPEPDPTLDGGATIDSGPPSPPLPSRTCIEKATAVREPMATSFSANPLDPLGYMPFAEDGCGLVYVSKQGRLTRVDFETGEREAIDASFVRATRPSARDGVLAWEATDGNGRGVVRVRVGGKEPITIPGAYAKAFEPRVGFDAVVFTFTNGNPDRADADLDVAVYTPSTGAVAVVGDGPGQQRFGAVGKGFAAYSDFSEDPTGTFSERVPRASDIVIVDLGTKMRTRREAPGKQAFPLLDDDGLLLYTDFGDIHPEPKFSAYAIKLGKIGSPIGQDRLVHESPKIGSSTPWIQPSLGRGFVSWIEGDSRLMRRATSLASPATKVAESDEGFVGVVDGTLAAFVAARGPTRFEVFLEARKTR